MKTCPQCTTGFEVTGQDRQFYAKMNVPEPTLCPMCRMQRRMAFRNERHLYKRKCDLTGKEIISVHSPESPYKIYDQHAWWSDQWDPLSFGRDFDFNRSFFEQFLELCLQVPQISLQNRNNENSDYCNDCDHLKNCYLCFNGERAEDCYYCNTFGLNSRNCMDMLWCMTCELCYECTKVQQSYEARWCFNSSNLNDCYFCQECQVCRNCFGCVGLRQKQYCIYNQQVSKEAYEKFIKNFTWNDATIKEAKQKLQQLWLQVPHKNVEMRNAENCTGDHISDSKNCVECFDVLHSENCKYVWNGLMNNGYDCFNTGMNTNFLYECVGAYHCTNTLFSIKCSQSSDVYYSNFCVGGEYLFGCTGLRHKKYCILNKQYTREEYEKMIPRIIQHMKKTKEWGEFFPPHHSFFGYNDSMAQDDFPLTKEEAIKKGFKWNDYKSSIAATKKIPAAKLPESITDIPDDVLNWAIECAKDQRLFRIIPQELKFYRENSIPIPHLCPDCRHYERKAQINPRHLWNRTCAKCSKSIQTTYAPDRSEIVYCEACYLKEVY